jgi:hypothetical protein
MKPLFFTLILLGSFSAYANEAQNGPTPRTEAQCAPLDIRPMHPQLTDMWNHPRDQDGVGWCYAYAAADLLSVEAGMNVSAAELSYRYNRNIERSLLSRVVRNTFDGREREIHEGGFVNNAVKEGLKRGVCAETILPSDSQIVSWQNNQMLQVFDALTSMRDNVRNGLLTPASLHDCVDCSVVRRPLFQAYFPGSTMEDIYNTVAANADKNMNQILYELAQKYCGDKRQSLAEARVRKHGKGGQSGRRMFQHLDGALSRGKPVGYSFSFRLFDEDTSGGHAVTIVAREHRGGECKYFIRNSWGAGCAGIKRPELKNDCDPALGGMWVNERLLHRYMDDITYVD